jgi:hypothetical protein
VVEPIHHPSADFDRELREQLRARSAPPNFTARLMARVEARTESRRPLRLFFRRPQWGWAALAAVLAATLLGGVERDRQQRIAGQRARQQVLLALRITSSTLHQVQQKVNDQATPAPSGAGAQQQTEQQGNR